MAAADPTQDVSQRPVLASFDNYLDAQKAVDILSDNKFAVQHLTIVGVDIRIVESVLGRMSWGRAAVSGLAAGAWFGVLIGLFLGLFASPSSSVTGLILLGLLWGAAAGIIFGLISYGLTGGKRDFVSRQALVAGRYDVLCDPDRMAEARRVLGIAVTGTPAGTINPPIG